MEGYLDALDNGQVFGWAWDRLNPTDRLQIELRIEGRVAAIATADRQRPDLAEGNIGDGAHSFVATLDEETEADAISAEAVSPTTGDRYILALRVPASEAAANAALLRKVASAVDAIGQGQRRLGAALREVRGKTPNADHDRISRQLAEIRDAQAALAKQQAGLEIFLMRFETMLRNVSGCSEAAAAPVIRVGLLDRLFR